MRIDKPAKKPAKNVEHSLTPVLPAANDTGLLKDMAQEIVVASSRLEGRVAPETARAIGDHLRLVNSYYSNLIEGHKTTIPEIHSALRKEFADDDSKRYAQELCAAHVEVERRYMQSIAARPGLDVCSRQFLCDLHADVYAHLPEAHRFTHTGSGFTPFPVNPGKLRDVDVSVDGQSMHGPDCQHLSALMNAFAKIYSPERFHGDERLIAMAASHHRLTWLHPFRDGNGRVARLFSGLYLAASGINRSNLWSLSRGLSRNKEQYMFELWAADSPDTEQQHYFDGALLADFCEFFFKICMDQIGFMETLLRLDQIEDRIDWYVAHRRQRPAPPIRIEAAKLLKAIFTRGSMARGKAAGILNMSERTARRTVSALLSEGLLRSKNHRAPLTIGLPLSVLPYYFPDLYDPVVMGEGHPSFMPH